MHSALLIQPQPALFLRRSACNAAPIGALLWAGLHVCAVQAQAEPAAPFLVAENVAFDDQVAVAARDEAPAPIRFATQFLMGGSERIDPARFERGNQVSAGSYNADIHVNGTWLVRGTVRYAVIDDRAEYCADPQLLRQAGLNVASLATPAQQALGEARNGRCVPMSRIVPEAQAAFDMGKLRLLLSIPQAMLTRAPRGYVDPGSWDKGMDAALLRYSGTFYHSGGRAGGDSAYVGLDAGLNLAGWAFRHQGSFFAASQGPARYRSISTYAERALPGMKSRLVLGDSFTDGAVFDTLGIRGFQIASDDRMLADSQRGYAPSVRGIARTNARVTVTQNGTLLYETTVAPGPFEINDLYVAGYGANLDVVVTEADGSRSHFSVPYAAAPQLVRKGRLRYALVGGVLRDQRLGEDSAIAQATAQYGLSNRITLYGGVTLADGYEAALAGAALNTRIGAFAADVSGSRTELGGEWLDGERLRLSYSAFIEPTQTNIGVAAFVLSSSGYYDARMAAEARAAENAAIGDTVFFGAVDRSRRNFQLTISQQLGPWGNVYVVGTSSDYWNRPGTSIMGQAGYARAFQLGGLGSTFNADISRTRDIQTGRDETRFLASITLGLGRSPRSPTLTASAQGGNGGQSLRQARLNGVALEDMNLAYGLSAQEGQNADRYGGNVQYRANGTTLAASASGGDGGGQYSVGISGGIVVHAGGVNFANELGDTVGIVEARGAKGARVSGGTGIRIDGNGYAVVPYLSPYRRNSVAVDPRDLPLDVQFRSTSQEVAPLANAVVKLRYETLLGRSAIILVRMADGTAAPFGASLLDGAGVEKGVVGQQGRAFVSGLDGSGTLFIADPAEAARRCSFDYTLPADTSAYATLETVCTDLPAKPSTPPAGQRVAAAPIPQPGFSSLDHMQ